MIHSPHPLSTIRGSRYRTARIVWAALICFTGCDVPQDNPYDPASHRYRPLSAPVLITPDRTDSLILLWNIDGTHEYGFRVVTGTHPDSLVAIASLERTARSYRAALPALDTVWAAVEAVDYYGFGVRSAPVSIVPPPPPPPPPTGLSVVLTQGDIPWLRWSRHDNADFIDITRIRIGQPATSGDTLKAVLLPGSTTAWFDRAHGITAEQYRYDVRAIRRGVPSVIVHSDTIRWGITHPPAPSPDTRALFRCDTVGSDGRLVEESGGGGKGVSTSTQLAAGRFGRSIVLNPNDSLFITLNPADADTGVSISFFLRPLYDTPPDTLITLIRFTPTAWIIVYTEGRFGILQDGSFSPILPAGPLKANEWYLFHATVTNTRVTISLTTRETHTMGFIPILPHRIPIQSVCIGGFDQTQTPHAMRGWQGYCDEILISRPSAVE